MADPDAGAGVVPLGAELDELVYLGLEALEVGGREAFEKFCSEHDAHASRLRLRIAELERLGLVESVLGGARTHDAPERLGDFRLLRRLGAGGMGVVYEAEQISLGRRVALKLVRPELLNFEGSRARFRREIEAVARLSHPGIVPIYTVGEEHGVPFFAMELIDGCTLADVLGELAGRDPSELRGADLLAAVERHVARTPGTSSSSVSSFASHDASWLEVVARIGQQVAEALDHAHSRGVIHRDVKHSNVAITRSGRALLFDFGLAMREGSERLTRSGAGAGSLPYMSPEQLASRRDLDARTDVYSLGTTLYELACLQPAFEAADLQGMLRAIMDGSAPPLRSKSRAIPWDFHTVIATAMERDRERRYASAADLARDLGNLLARRPIEARRPGFTLRLLRWGQRNPRASAALMVTFVLALAGALVVTQQQLVLGRRIASQRDLAQARADELRQLATGFLFDFHDRIKALPGSTEARELVVARAQELLDTLSREQGADPTLRRDLALAEVRMGHVLGRPGSSNLGDPVRALDFYRRAADYLEGAASEPGAPMDVRRAWRELLFGRGDLLGSTGRVREALSSLERACDVAAEIERLLPGDPSATRDRIESEQGLAQALHFTGEPDRARAMREDCLLRVRELQAANPADESILRRLLIVLRDVAASREAASDADGCLAAYEEGARRSEQLFEQSPANVQNRRLFANHLQGLAGSLTGAGRTEEAIAAGERACSLQEELARIDPANLVARHEWASAATTVCEVLEHAGRLERAVEIGEPPSRWVDEVAASGRALTLRRSSAGLHAVLARVLHGLSRHAESLAHADRAAALHRELAQENPDDAQAAENLARFLLRKGQMHLDSGDVAAALIDLRESARQYERLVELSPGDLGTFQDLALTESLVGQALQRLQTQEGDREALEWLRRAVERGDALLDAESLDLVLLNQILFAKLSCAEVELEVGDAAQGRLLLEQARELARTVCERVSDNEDSSAYRRECLHRLEQVYREQGDDAAADEVLNELEQASGSARGG